MFADIFNVLVFAGNPVIDSDSLEDVNGFSQYKADDAQLHEQERDMPFRCIGYDGALYK